MNLILLSEDDFVAASRVRLAGRRRKHIVKVHRAKPGDSLVVGRLGGGVGRGTVLDIDTDSVSLDVVLDADPPPPIPVSLVLALPRPPMLRRLLAGVTAMGIKRIAIVDARAVERSFWQSHALAEDAVREQLLLGLEQGRDTILPEVELHPRLGPFVNDVLPSWLEGCRAYIAHPAPEVSAPEGAGDPALLAVGPEGGWSDDEIERFLSAGLVPLGLGVRPLRVETAVPALVARLL